MTGRLGAALLLAVLLIGAASARAAGLHALEGRPAAPPLVLNDLDGRPVTLSDFAGRIVIVNFWATWCAPCIRELPALERLARTLTPDKAAVLAVNSGQSPETVRRFLARIGVSVRVPVDTDSAVKEAWAVKALPTTYVLDRTGHAVYGAVGDIDWENPSIVAELHRLAAEPVP